MASIREIAAKYFEVGAKKDVNLDPVNAPLQAHLTPQNDPQKFIYIPDEYVNIAPFRNPSQVLNHKGPADESDKINISSNFTIYPMFVVRAKYVADDLEIEKWGTLEGGLERGVAQLVNRLRKHVIFTREYALAQALNGSITLNTATGTQTVSFGTPNEHAAASAWDATGAKIHEDLTAAREILADNGYGNNPVLVVHTSVISMLQDTDKLNLTTDTAVNLFRRRILLSTFDIPIVDTVQKAGTTPFIDPNVAYLVDLEGVRYFNGMNPIDKSLGLLAGKVERNIDPPNTIFLIGSRFLPYVDPAAVVKITGIRTVVQALGA